MFGNKMFIVIHAETMGHRMDFEQAGSAEVPLAHHT